MPRGHPAHPHIYDGDREGTVCEQARAPSRRAPFERRGRPGEGRSVREERGLRPGLRSIGEDTMSIFDHGATLVPDVVTEAEEERILLRISQAPWMTDLSRRVQHYGYRYDYRQPRCRPARPGAAPFPRWAQVDRRTGLHRTFDGRRPEQCIVNEYRPGQGHRDARRSRQSFGPVVVSLSLAAAWTMNFRPRSASAPTSAAGLASDEVVASPAPLRTRPARPGTLGLDARDRPRRHRGPQRDSHLRDVPHHRALISTDVPVRAQGKVVGYPADRRGGQQKERS